MEDYYKILNCESNATFAELKRNYQLLVKKHHPDKGAPSLDHFLLIDKAFKVLKDAQSRKDYDASLLAKNSSEHTLIYAQVPKDNVKLNPQGVFLYPCRCGEQFLIKQEHLDEPECLIECDECSNSILIM